MNSDGDPRNPENRDDRRLTDVIGARTLDEETYGEVEDEIERLNHGALSKVGDEEQSTTDE